MHCSPFLLLGDNAIVKKIMSMFLAAAIKLVYLYYIEMSNVYCADEYIDLFLSSAAYVRADDDFICS